MPFEIFSREVLDKLYKSACKYGCEKTREEWEDERYRLKTDLFYLAKNYLGYELVDNYYCSTHPDEQAENTGICKRAGCGAELESYPGFIPEPGKKVQSFHRELCSFFVQKRPDRSLYQQDDMKNRLVLCPRGSFKSSVDEADCVQWIIAFPQVRIGLLTATEGLGKQFIDKIKSFFICAPDGTGKYHPTPFQVLFPEHVMESDSEADDFFTTGAREHLTGQKITAPSIHAISLKKSTSGWHYDVGKYDDAVSNSNSGPGTTQDQRDSVRQGIDLARSLVDPAGYHDNLGTPYDESDAYSYQQEHSTDKNLKVLREPCWKLKDSALRKKEDDLVESDYHLLLPWHVKLLPPDDHAEIVPRLGYGFLHERQQKDIHNFACQYLCQPSAAKLVKFTEQIIRAHITQAEGLPQVYTCFSAWDLAYSVESGRDYTVGVVGWFDNNRRLFIVDIVRGRFSKSELPLKIASQAARWKVEKIGIENSPGADFLENDIKRALFAQNYDCTLEFFKVDSQKNAKNSRAEGLELLLVEDRLWFSCEIPIMNQVITEFTMFKPTAKRKDDIVDAIAHVSRYMPAYSDVPQNEQQRQSEMWKILREKEFHELIYGVRENAPPPITETLPISPATHEGYPVFSNTDEMIFGR